MPDKVFLDSNVLIYAYSSDDSKKRERVEKLLNNHRVIIISTQTVNEFINVMTKKKKMTYQQVSLVLTEILINFSVEIIDKVIIRKALEIAEKHHYSYFDSLMIASAVVSDCSILYTEDMHNQHVIEGNLRIVDPFK